MLNATFVSSRKRAWSQLSDGWDAVHTYGRLSLLKGEGEDLFPQLATATLQSEENYGLQDQQQRETPV